MADNHKELLTNLKNWSDIISQISFLFRHQGLGVITKYNIGRGRVSIHIADNPECNYIVKKEVEREPELLKGVLKGIIELVIGRSVESRFTSKKISNGKSLCVLDIYF
jgi:hypothetical protein